MVYDAVQPCTLWQMPTRAMCRLQALHSDASGRFRGAHGRRSPATEAECSATRQRLRSTAPDGVLSLETWSQVHQDWVVALLFATVLTPQSRTYVDLAANGPIFDSNTYLFDRCLGWQGVCIEANPQYAAHHAQTRSSTFISACVAPTPTDAFFDMTSIGQLGHLVTASAHNKTGTVRAMRCEPLAHLLAPFPRISKHIDYLSLDVEGAELGALQSIDWAQTSVSLMTVEDATSAIVTLLAAQQMVPVMCIMIDTVFVHVRHAADVKAWLRTVGSRLLTRGEGARAHFNSSAVPLLSNRTTDCRDRFSTRTARSRPPLPLHHAMPLAAGVPVARRQSMRPAR